MTAFQAIGLAVVAASVFGICDTSRAEQREISPPVHDCDRLAANPLDSAKVTDGVLMEQIDAARAIAACKSALAAHPGTPRFHYQLGRALQRSKSYDDALVQYRAAADRGYLRAMLNIGLAYGNGQGTAKNSGKALEWFRKAAEQGDAGALTYIGIAYLNGWGVAKNPDLAISKCTETIRRVPSYELAYVCRASAYLQKHDFDRAIAEYGEAIRFQPKWAYSYFLRGRAYLKKREYDRAIADFNETIRLQATTATVYVFRGSAYETLGRKTDAISDYRKALLLDPTDKNATEGLKRLGAKPF